MYFEHAHIKNFRGIENLSLDFKSGVNILLGDNGTEKKQRYWRPFGSPGGIFAGIGNIKVRGLLQDDFRQKMVRLRDASGQITYHVPEIEFGRNI